MCPKDRNLSRKVFLFDYKVCGVLFRNHTAFVKKTIFIKYHLCILYILRELQLI